MGLAIPARRATRRTTRAAPCRSSRRPPAARKEQQPHPLARLSRAASWPSLRDDSRSTSRQPSSSGLSSPLTSQRPAPPASSAAKRAPAADRLLICAPRTAPAADSSMAYSTAHSAPLSIAGVHPWMSHPLSRAASRLACTWSCRCPNDRPGSAAPGAGVDGVTASRRHRPSPSPSSCSCCRLRGAALAGGPHLAGRLSRASHAAALHGPRAKPGHGRRGSLTPAESSLIKLPEIYS